MTFLSQLPMGPTQVTELLVGIIAPFVIAMIIQIVLYFLKAAAFYKLSKNRGLSGSALSFIPIIGVFVAGNVADDINSKMGKRSGFRYGMLITSIIPSIGWLLTYPMMANFIAEVAINPPSEDVMIALMLQKLGVIALMSAASLVTTIVSFVVNYRIYSDYAPQNATLFTVLAIFIRITETFFLFSIRNKPSLSIQHANRPPQQQIFL